VPIRHGVRIQPMNSPIRILLTLLSGLLLYAVARAESKDFDERPLPVKSVAPAYPAAMRRDHVSGLVTLRVVVNENGDVLERTVTKSSRPEFEAPALEAVQQWKFKPAKKGGIAVKATISIPIKFTAES
jgi:periplasmic protein TonB